MQKEIYRKLNYLSNKSDVISITLLDNESLLTEEDNKTNVNFMDQVYKSTKNVKTKFDNCKHLYNDINDSPMKELNNTIDQLVLVVENFETNLNALIEVKKHINELVAGKLHKEKT